MLFLNKLKPRSLRADRKPLDGLYSAITFHEMLQRERARSERNRNDFSLIVFNLKYLIKDDETVRFFIQALKKRLRRSDRIGWFDHNKIGVMLSDTGANGAYNFVEDIPTPFGSKSPSVPRRIYTYSNPWTAGNNKIATREEFSKPAQNLQIALGRRTLWWKRALDIAGSLIGIIVFAPLMALIAIAIKLTSPGKIIFRQKRVGIAHEPFEIYKFRTMVADVPDDLHKDYLYKVINGSDEEDGGEILKLTDDPRVTPVGRILRRWSLDELPQLFNVLIGDMSLVGPRPEPNYAYDNYSHWYHRRCLDTKPGLTGLWQVEGRCRVSYEDMIRMDLRYGQHISLLSDLKLLFRTVKAVLSRSGAY